MIEKNMVFQLIYSFLDKYQRWASSVDQAKHKTELQQIYELLMLSSDQYFTVVFELSGKPGEAEQIKQDSPRAFFNAIDKAFKFYHDMQDVCTNIFLYMLSYFNQKNLHVELRLRRKNFKSMLQKLFEQLQENQKQNYLSKKKSSKIEEEKKEEKKEESDTKKN